MKIEWLDGESMTAAALAAEGIPNEQLTVGDHDARIEAVRRDGGYVTRDEVRLSPSTPDLPRVLAKFADEHRHDEDEVRFVLDGEGIFEIRSRDDRWMRVTVSPGDLIVVPKGRWHRFFLGATSTIHCVRLFQDTAGWVPHYRDAATTAQP